MRLDIEDIERQRRQRDCLDPIGVQQISNGVRGCLRACMHHRSAGNGSAQHLPGASYVGAGIGCIAQEPAVVHRDHAWQPTGGHHIVGAMHHLSGLKPTVDPRAWQTCPHSLGNRGGHR